MWCYLSTPKMTVMVEVDKADIITNAPPIVARFRGQKLDNLRRWMGLQGAITVEEGRNDEENG